VCNSMPSIRSKSPGDIRLECISNKKGPMNHNWWTRWKIGSSKLIFVVLSITLGSWTSNLVLVYSSHPFRRRLWMRMFMTLCIIKVRRCSSNIWDLFSMFYSKTFLVTLLLLLLQGQFNTFDLFLFRVFENFWGFFRVL
jgi:hypothetical protein